MNLVDSSGWLKYLIDGVNADSFVLPIGDPANLVTRRFACMKCSTVFF